MTVMERLKILRQTLNLSQKEFAKRIFISSSHYTCLETGHRNIKERILDAISKTYNANKEWLLTGKGEMFDTKPPDVRLEELVGVFKGLNGYFQEYLLDQVRQLDAIQKKEARWKK
jgi:transcriptional regulator with XRE-family HTH domain